MSVSDTSRLLSALDFPNAILGFLNAYGRLNPSMPAICGIFVFGGFMKHRNYFYTVNGQEDELAMLALKELTSPFSDAPVHTLEEVALEVAKKHTASHPDLGNRFTVSLFNGLGEYIATFDMTTASFQAKQIDERTSDVADLSPERFNRFGSWQAFLMSLAEVRLDNRKLKKQNGELRDTVVVVQDENRRLQRELELLRQQLAATESVSDDGRLTV